MHPGAALASTSRTLSPASAIGVPASHGTVGGLDRVRHLLDSVLGLDLLAASRAHLATQGGVVEQAANLRRQILRTHGLRKDALDAVRDDLTHPRDVRD